MKKLLYCAAALAMAFFAGSCQQEKLEPVAENGQVTFTVKAPATIQTKAIADGKNVEHLIYEVWLTKTLGELENDAQFLYQATTTMDAQPDGSRTATLSLDLVNDQQFTVLFWAQVDDPEAADRAYDTEFLTAVKYNKEMDKYNANDESLAAFYSVAYVHDCMHVTKDGKATGSEVVLRRPFAQLNLGTLNTSTETGSTTGYKIVIEKSNMILEKVPTTFNVVNSEVSGAETITFAMTAAPCADLSSVDAELPGFENPSYWYAGMNYVFAGNNVKLTYNIQTKIDGQTESTVNNTVYNVPLKENHRTNIIGNLLTSRTDYQIVVDAKFDTNENSGNSLVLGEGIVKNQNGDYEVSNARGLAYAINNLFVEGGKFYIIKSIDMTGVKYNPTNIPSGVTVEIIGQVPAVTRSVSEPITITGLEYGALININDGSALISNIMVSGSDDSADEPAFINVNNGSAEITNCEATTQSFIGENNGSVNESNNTTEGDTPIIKEDNGETLTKVGTADELVAALEAKKGVVFTNDIVIDPANMSNAYGKTGINVKYGQTIDGDGYTLDIHGAGGTWDSGISTTGGLIRNIIVTGSFRGIFVKGGNEPVVLDNVTLEGVTYTISCDEAKNQTLVATNSTFKGWTSYAKTLGSAKFIDCTFAEGNGYAFCRPYAPTEFVGCEFEAGYRLDPKAEITLNNCTLNGVAITSANLSELVTNTDNAATPTTVGTADELVAALENGENVFFANDIKIEPANMSNAYGTTGINVKNGQAIDGGNHTLNIQGAGGTWDSGINTTGGLIKNLTVTGSFRGIFINHNSTHSEKVVLENVTIDGTVYTISCDQGTNQGFEATNSTFNGWTSYAATLGSVAFTGCSFGEGNGYAFCRPYAPTEFVGCAFEAGFEMDPRAEVTFKNCTIGGVALTTDNLSTLVSSNIQNVASVNGMKWVAEGVCQDIDEVFYLTSQAGLVWFADQVNVQKNAFSGKTVKLAANIDLNNESWTPVGQTGATTFNGVFDGQNHTISNLNVNSEAQTGEHYSSGLFGWVESHTAGHGHIKNVKISGATVTGHHNCGALVGYITQETALVENCHVTGATISCTYANGDADGDKAGALIGNATVATPVKDCTAAKSTVSAGRDAGQVIGAGNEANVTGCSATEVTVAANGTGTGANVRNEVIGRLLK